VRVVASSYRAIDRSVTRWIVVTMVEWSSEVRWELVLALRVRNVSDPRSDVWSDLKLSVRMIWV